ncbi:MAG: rhodanese-like domain-containing protein [Gammaproteobacteria bacterium]|jgi:thiosulfate sulfurtransferase
MSYFNLVVNQVDDFLNRPDAIALDIRDFQSYAAGHLQGAEHADEQCMSQLIRKRRNNPPILVYCYHGNTSRDFASLIHKLGFEQVYHLEGGWKAWSEFANT